MSPDDQSLSEQVQRTFSQHGRSWRDYVLLADKQPPSIFAVSTDGVALLHILAIACREFLTRNGVRTFATFDEFDQVFPVREVKVRKVNDVA